MEASHTLQLDLLSQLLNRHVRLRQSVLFLVMDRCTLQATESKNESKGESEVRPTILLLSMMILLSSDQMHAGQSDVAATSPHRFQAKWITAEGVPGHDPAVLRLRKEVDLATTPKHYIVHVSADNQFLLVVNGRRIGQGPAIGDVQHWRYETYDLAAALHAGRNLIAATVWNLGDEAPIRQMTSHLGFVMDPDSPAESAIATDASWLARADSGFHFLPKPSELKYAYYVASPGERLDASAIDWTWSDPATVAAAPEWQHAISIGKAVERGVHSEENSWLLVRDELPAMEYSPTSPGRVVRMSGARASKFPDGALEIPANAHVTLLLDRETLTTAYPTLSLSGGKGSLIKIRYAEALVDANGNKGNRNEIEGKQLVGVEDEVRPDGAVRAFTPLDWRTWRFLGIEATTAGEPLRLESLTAMFTAFPFEQKAKFESDDPTLVDIWKVGWRTARLCAHDAYMDTPYWERLQYVGDTRIQTLISYTNTGDDRLARQAIAAFYDSLLPEGITQSRYPSRHLQVIQNFSLLWVGMVHDFWFYRNDSGFVRERLPGVRSVLSYFRSRRNADGLPTLTDWWPFVDWAEGFAGGDSPAVAGVSASGGLFYLEALRNAAEMETSLGDAGLAKEDAEEAARLQKTILLKFWSPREQLIADTEELTHFSQQANALAVWLDVIPTDQQAEVITRVYSARDSAFHSAKPLPREMSVASNYFRFYLTRALVHAGLGDRYLETLGPWHTMLRNGLSTWAEQPEPTRSDSHAWSAHPNIDLLTTVAGITPSAPGFGKVRIAPGLGGLRHLAVTYPSPRGGITVEYTVRAEGMAAEVNLPKGLPGELLWKGKSYVLRDGINRLNLP